MNVEVQYAIEVMEGIAATIEEGVYNTISKTPVNPLMLDDTAIGLLEQAAGTSLQRIVSDAGETLGYVAKGVANAGNGAATEVSTYVNVLTKETIVDAEMITRQPVDIATGEVAALTVGETVTEVSAGATGAGLLATSVPATGVAIGVALGLTSGYLLYEIAPDFWTGVADKLMEAGELVAGKVNGIFDTAGKTSYSGSVIEIYKNAFLEAGFFDPDFKPGEPMTENDILTDFNGNQHEINANKYNQYNFSFRRNIAWSPQNQPLKAKFIHTQGGVDTTYYDDKFVAVKQSVQRLLAHSILARTFGDSGGNLRCSLGYENEGRWTSYVEIYGQDIKKDEFTLQSNGKQGTALSFSHQFSDSNYYEMNYPGPVTSDDVIDQNSPYYMMAYYLRGSFGTDNTQEDATLPTEEPFEDTYPDWTPSQNIQDKPYYPTSMPTEDGKQDPAQTGDNDDDQLDIIADIIFNPNPIPEPQPQPEPDPQPQPEPQPDPDTPTPAPDPVDPNPEPDPSDPSPTIPIISGIHATKMCTIYNPTDGEVDDLGAFLWVDNVIEQIRLIFQDPMDGIISLHKIYAQPVTGTRKDIILGYIDSGVDALEVTQQFTTVNCRSVTVPKIRDNVTDYPPYTQAHIYLPFIGIEEIDVSEIMGGTVRVQYRVDAYTGTCVAQIFVTRSPDMTSEQMLYTFSGNASQTIPLTSANFTGLVSSLVSIAGGAATAGAGGALLAAGRSLTTHMASVSHSGSISANAGIMGPRVPYIILTRQQPYDANGYNNLYGYPTNKTVYLSNCHGYVRVKDVLYRGDGTEAEKQEVVSLLKSGVIAPTT
jgi:hypothetical protein